MTHIYAFDACGNYVCYVVPTVDVKNAETTEPPKQPATPTKPTTAETKKKQTIYANSFIKNYGAKDFSVGARTSGDGKLTYKSSNKKVVTVSSRGKVRIKGIGIAKITITAQKTASCEKGTKTITVTVRPKTTKTVSLKNRRSKKLEIRWKRDAKVSGYKIQVATNKSFKNAKTYIIRKNRTVSKTITIKKKKTYYVRICTYKGNLTSEWNSAKKLKIKR